MKERRCFALLPRDGLFCKDGRGWHTSATGRGYTLEWPWPSTVLGAIRTAWGRLKEERQGRSFGPDEWREWTAAVELGRTLALRRPHAAAWSTDYRVWPVPADALWLQERGCVYRLDPAPGDVQTLGLDEESVSGNLWWPQLEEGGKPLPAPRWWSDADFCDWLAGREVPVRDRRDTLIISRRRQVHVGIQPEELTADEGKLFSHDVLETLEFSAEWGIGVEVGGVAGDLPGFLTLGSDRHLVSVEKLPTGLFDPPEKILGAFRSGSNGLRLLVVTPACFRRGWLPDGFTAVNTEYRGRLPGVQGEVILRAAFVPRPIHVSGWDMAANGGRGAAKPTTRLVPPGAVFFFHRADARPFDEADARSLWLAAVGDRTSEGFGRVVPGVWNPSAKRGNER